MSSVNPVGRFAPTPSGGLHLGSICTALASYLNIKAQGGRWILRIDDLDTTRSVAGASTMILKTLEALGFEWSGKVVYQSANSVEYEEIINSLENSGALYPCICSRKLIGNGLYQGTCRERQVDVREPHSLRVRLDDRLIKFKDLIKGQMLGRADQLFGDFVVKRTDGHHAYHLATVVDDYNAGITEIVRGDDLLQSTFPQLWLYEKLGFRSPIYSHITTIKDDNGIKLSKQTGAKVITPDMASFALSTSLELLGLSAPKAMGGEKSDILLKWALSRWKVYQSR
jgi:glutamyl-Q tRNA(Asp) synthetase